jgi:hypothetical protein
VTTAEAADESPRQGGTVCTLILRVRLDDVMTGCIGLVGRERALSFRGWIDFMSALHDLRSEAHRIETVAEPANSTDAGRPR